MLGRSRVPSLSHTVWDLGGHAGGPRPTARCPPSLGWRWFPGVGQGLPRAWGLLVPQQPSQAGADAAVPCRATARAAPGERPRLGSQTQARRLRRLRWLRHRQLRMLRLWLSHNTCLRHQPQQPGFTETRLSWGRAWAPTVTQLRPPLQGPPPPVTQEQGEKRL